MSNTAADPLLIVPADDKENARLLVSKTVFDVLKELKISCPSTSAERVQELQSIQKQLSK